MTEWINMYQKWPEEIPCLFKIRHRDISQYADIKCFNMFCDYFPSIRSEKTGSPFLNLNCRIKEDEISGEKFHNKILQSVRPVQRYDS
jgi:hypothetical protein